VSSLRPAVDESALGADESITAEREEIKYLVPSERLEPILSAVCAELQPHRFTGEGANRLPDPHQFVTTVYFDTPSRRHYREATLDAAHNIKVRAKEYYDVHPSLAELATDPAQIVRYQPWAWFEIKRRNGAHTSKRRFRVPKQEVPSIFTAGKLSTESLWAEAERELAQAGLMELAEYTETLGEPLSASALVNYRRLSWQDPRAQLRVTLDLGLAFFAPPSDLWSRKHALVRNTLGPILGRELDAVLEVKCRSAVPAWLAQSLERAGVRPRLFSKFVAANGVVHAQS
jgi:hypothetical protein